MAIFVLSLFKEESWILSLLQFVNALPWYNHQGINVI